MTDNLVFPPLSSSASRERGTRMSVFMFLNHPTAKIIGFIVKTTILSVVPASDIPMVGKCGKNDIACRFCPIFPKKEAKMTMCDGK